MGLARQKVGKNKLVATPLATRKAFSASSGAGIARNKQLRKCLKYNKKITKYCKKWEENEQRHIKTTNKKAINTQTYM